MLVSHEVVCPCGVRFTAIQPTAKYHSDACRSKAYRQRIQNASGQPILGISSDAAAAFDDLYRSASPLAVSMLRNFRIRRGATIASEAIYICLATCRPDLIDPGLSTGQFHYENCPDTLKGVT